MHLILIDIPAGPCCCGTVGQSVGCKLADKMWDDPVRKHTPFVCEYVRERECVYGVCVTKMSYSSELEDLLEEE